MKKKKEKHKEKPDHSYIKYEKGYQIHTNNRRDMETEENLRIITEQQSPNRFKKPKKKSNQPPLLVPINEEHEYQPPPPPVTPQLIIETIPQPGPSYSHNLSPQNIYDPLPHIANDPLPSPSLEISQNPFEQLFFNKFGHFSEYNPMEDHEYAEPADLIDETTKIGELGEQLKNQEQQKSEIHSYIPMESRTENQSKCDRLISGIHQNAQGTSSQLINEANQGSLNNSETLQPVWENEQGNNSIITDYIDKDLELNPEQNEPYMNCNNTDQTLPISIEGLLEKEHLNNEQVDKEQQTQNPQEKEQWEKIEVTTNIRKLRKILNMKLPTWYTIILLMSESAVKINAM